MKTLTHASVFSGIGGPEVAATMLGIENLFHCEINPFGRAVLDYWFPNSKSYEDITKTDFSEWRGKVTILTGGFPCQPFSYAGQRRGVDDDRYLWPYMFRCIDQIQPTWVVAENVAGITTMVEQGEVSQVASQGSLFDEDDGVRGYRLDETFTIERICQDLEGHGYSVQPILIPACAVGAPHRRDRVFIIGRRAVADADNDRKMRGTREYEGEIRKEGLQERNEIQQPNKPAEIRPEGLGNASPHSPIGGKGTPREGSSLEGSRSNENQQQSQRREPTERSDRFYELLRYATDTSQQYERTQSEQPETRRAAQGQSGGRGVESSDGIAGCGRWQAFPSVSPIHRGNDGLPFNVDDLSISFPKWRTESLKAYGNAIVPQVMYEIFKAIKEIEQEI